MEGVDDVPIRSVRLPRDVRYEPDRRQAVVESANAANAAEGVPKLISADARFVRFSARVNTVGDLWDTRTGDFHTAASLRLTARRRQRLIAAIPAAWADTLRRGRRPITPGEWALAPLMPGLAGHPRYGTLVEIQATIHSTATVIAYEVMTCGGWRAAGVRHLQLQDLRRATMEPGRKQIHGIGELVTLHGLTSTDFASCRARLTWRNRTAITFNVKTGCEMLRGDSKMTDELTTLRAAIPPPRHAAGFADIRAAAWLPKTRDFAWCLRAGALHCGRAAGLDTSRCVICDQARDSTLHLVADCRYLTALRSWCSQRRGLLKLPPVSFVDMAVHGCGSPTRSGDAHETHTAVLGAVLTAMAKARAYALLNHDPMRSATIVNAAKAHMRHHLNIDWMHARGEIPARAGSEGHHDSRPSTRQAFRVRWNAITKGTGDVLDFGPVVTAASLR
jgi:hypothetical protein